MNKTKVLLGVLLVSLPAMIFAGSQSDVPGIETLVSRIQESLAEKDFDAYLDLFLPSVRADERTRIETIFNDYRMESVSLKLAGRTNRLGEESRLFFQVTFENAFSAILENWQVSASLRDGRWEITNRESTGAVRTLYKIQIPAERAERARSVEITHRDIRLSFRNPVLFFDNIPGMETAIVIIGKGRVQFTPSDANERHQLEILYRKRSLDADLEYVFIRCSDEFFHTNVSVEKEAGLKPVTEAEKNRAYAVFVRNYPRSYTIENPLDQTMLSFLPQGREAVFEFKAKKAGELTYIYHPFSDEEVNLYDRRKDRVISLYHPQDDGDEGKKRLFVSFEDKYDIEAYDLEVGYTPAQSYMTGKARIRVAPLVDSLDSLKFRFSSSLQILKIQDEAGRDLFYSQDRLRKLLYIYFIEPPIRGNPASVDVLYRGRITPPAPITDVIAQSGVQNRVIFEPRYETYLFTQNAFWYPAPSEEDYFTCRMKLVIPPEYKCVATGQMVDKWEWEEMDDVVEIEKAGSGVYVFESRKPVKYMAFIMGKFDRQREDTDPIPIQTYISNEVMSVSQNLFDQAKDILDYYIRSFGPFPFDKLGVVLRVWPSVGGHSPASFIVLNEMAWVGERHLPLSFDTPVSLFDWDEFFLSHEIAHQWWGQGVSYYSYRDQWLSEGLAQFASASYLREKYGERAYADILKKFNRWTQKKSNKGAIILGARLSYYDYEAYQAIIYNKAAMVLMMLQDFIGKETFFRGLREFFETYKFNPARTQNFIRVMETVSGRDLGDFFRGWFYSHELPEVQTSSSSEQTSDGYVLKIRVSQTNGRFAFPLWIEWKIGEKVYNQIVLVTDSSHEFVLPVEGKPENVRINPLKAVPGKID